MAFPKMTDLQMEALEIFICRSKDCGELAKKGLIWLLRQTEGLTKPLCLNCRDEYEVLGKEISYAVHDMNSGNGTTIIQVFLYAMGTPFQLSTHAGSYSDDGVFHETCGYAIWIAPFHCDDESLKVTPDANGIKQIVLKDWFDQNPPLFRGDE